MHAQLTSLLLEHVIRGVKNVWTLLGGFVHRLLIAWGPEVF